MLVAGLRRAGFSQSDIDAAIQAILVEGKFEEVVDTMMHLLGMSVSVERKTLWGPNVDRVYFPTLGTMSDY